MTEPRIAPVVAGASDSQLASDPQPPVLRRLQWPQPAPVDLLQQCPWLVLHQKPSDEWLTRETRQEGDALDPEQDEADDVRHDDFHGQVSGRAERSSPLKQRLRVRRETPVAQSPAQRAAKKMLKLQDEMMQQEERQTRMEASSAPKKLKHAPMAAFPMSNSANSPPKANSQPLKKRPGRTKTMNGPKITSPDACLQHWLTEQCPSTIAERPLSLEYSMEMETRIHSKMNHTLGKGLWKDEVSSLIAAELTSESVFGGSVPTRRLAYDPTTVITKEPSKSEEALEEDSSKSMDISIVSKETIADGPKTETTTGVAATTSIPPPWERTGEPFTSPTRVSAVEMFADEVRDEARELVAEGQVHDALLSLQAGIDRVLHDFHDDQDEILTHGFDYSALAHAKAIRLQLTYKARHRHRLSSLVVLQRVWRRFRAHRDFLKQRHYQTTNAKVIQCNYKKRFYHRKRESSATRIQRCFRIFQQQKTLIRLHQACRMLNTQERRKRERMQARKALRRRLWSKMKIALRIIRLFRIRRFSICWLQSHWRGWKARQSYSAVLSVATEAEISRRGDEDAFVEPRLARVMEIMRAFYSETAPGQAQVRWATRQPWLRWRRLCSEWEQVSITNRVEALCAIYRPDTVLHGLELRAIEALVLGKTVAFSPRKRGSDTKIGDLHEWLQPAASQLPPASTRFEAAAERPSRWHRVMHRATTAVSRVKSKWNTCVKSVEQRATNARDRGLWKVVFYPRLVIRNSTLRQQRREDARQELLTDQHRVWQAFLRHVFRQTQGAPPKFVCTWCGEGHATSKAYYSHRNAIGGCIEHQRKLEKQKTETVADVNCHLNRFKIMGKWRRQQTAPIKTIPEEPAVLDSICRRLAKQRPSKAALRRLLDAAQWCGASESTEPSSLFPCELLTLLLSTVDDAGGHPLVRIHTFAVKDASWNATGAPPVGWITTEEIEHGLGLSPAADVGSRRHRSTWEKLQEAAKSTWRASRQRGERYRSRIPAISGPWRSRILAAA